MILALKSLSDRGDVKQEAVPSRRSHSTYNWSSKHMAKVLVVDDEAAISQLLECYLTACGHKVTKSRSSLGSLGWLDAAVFDVVVLDVVMAGPIDGIEVCRTLKSDSRTAGTAVLVISALPYADSPVGPVPAQP